MSTVQELFDRALELSPEQREELAERILQTTNPDPPGEDISHEEWEEEIAARIERFERGETQARDAFEALADIRKNIREARNQ